MRKGLTLVEIAIVLVIIGLLMFTSVRSCISSMKGVRVDKTKDELTTCENRILEMICRDLSVDNSSSCPFKDGWGNEIHVYVPDSVSGKNICSLRETGFLVKTDSNVWSNVAVLFLSSGENGTIDSKITNSSAEIKGDDISLLLTLKEIQGKCCSGKQLRITYKDFTPIVEGEDYEEGILIRGGTPPYRCRITIGNLTIENLTNSTCFIDISYNDTEKLVNQFGSQGYVTANVTVSDSYNNTVSKLFRITLIKRFR